MHEADLHNHTTASDGDFAPTELIEAYAKLGIRAVAITDHDTIAGVQEALDAGKRLGVDVLPGVEVTIRFAEDLFRGSLHLLLYFPAELLDDATFLEETNKVLALGRGDALVRARLKELNKWFGPQGIEPRLPRDLTAEDLYSQTSQVSRRHFAVSLEKLGISSPEDRTRIIGNDSPAYIPSGMDLTDLPPLLAKYPFVCVLAHPAAGSFPGKSHYKEVLPPLETVIEILPRFIAIGLHGLEVEYPAHTPELARRTDAVRQEFGLPLATGGSDCHDQQQRPPGTNG
ncbi:MAG: PHP domain-containing protein, partial [Proteobacteria bacterium]|nr:PHP domain-containing protein [Pseudomonadota bacterium]